MTVWMIGTVALGAFCFVANLFAIRHFSTLEREHRRAGSSGIVMASVKAGKRRSVLRAVAGVVGIGVSVLPATVWVASTAIQAVLAAVSVSDWWAAKQAARARLEEQ